jgi:hypothetical protein
MAKNVSLDQVLTEAQQILHFWQANPTFKLGEMGVEDFQASLAALQSLNGEVGEMRTRLTGVLNRRDDQAKSLNDLNTRVRSGVRGVFGPDSGEYEQVGGTRRSERKSPTRKPKPVLSV